MKTAAGRRLIIRRIENSVAEAMPDTIIQNRNGSMIWVENKYLEDWPVRETTLPLRNSFERGQLGFLRQSRDWKGHAFVLIRVKDDFILLNPSHPLQEMTKGEIMSMAALVVGKDNIIRYLEQL